MEENLEGKKQVTNDGEGKNLYSVTKTFTGEKLGYPGPGYKFHPAADELLMDYLMNKIMGYELPVDLIEEIDLYAYDPRELPMSKYKYGSEKEVYFFTLMQQSSTETEPTKRNRITKGGYWQAIGAEIKIYHEGEIVGYRNTFLFYMGQAPKGKKSSWAMQEFRLNPSLVPVEELSDSIKTKFERYVVCKIKNIAI